MTFVVCPNWPNYLINEDGEIKNKKGYRKPYLTTTGYYYIVMRHEGLEKACAVHRLVCEAFVGQPTKEKNCVAHFDGNKTNNNYKNLRYVTRSENERDKLMHGRSNRGERQGRSVLKQNHVIEIKQKLKLGLSQREIASIYGVHQATIGSIKQGKSWFWL